MGEQNTFDRDAVKLQPLAPIGLLDQFNLPPKAIRFIRRHQRAIWLAISAGIVLAVAISGFTTWREYQDNKAAAALDAARIAKQDNRQLLEKVIQEYEATSSGLWAKIELALLEEKDGQRSQAINRLTAINAGLPARSPLKPLLLTKLVGLHEQEQQFDQAIALCTELAAIEGFGPAAYRVLGRLHELSGKQEAAIAMYGKYLELTGAQSDQGKSDPMRDVVQSKLNQLKK